MGHLPTRCGAGVPPTLLVMRDDPRRGAGQDPVSLPRPGSSPDRLGADTPRPATGSSNEDDSDDDQCDDDQCDFDEEHFEPL